jgi:hypothetical protein
MKAAILTLILVVAFSAEAAAEWGLYANRDNKAWKMERTFAFEKDCQAAAHALWKTGTVKGVGCQEYSATAFARRQPTPPSNDKSWKPPAADRTKNYSWCNNQAGTCLNREYTYKTNSDGTRSVKVEDTYTPADGRVAAPGVTKPPR